MNMNIHICLIVGTSVPLHLLSLRLSSLATAATVWEFQVLVLLWIWLLWCYSIVVL